jgi:hypothetical protein
MRIFTIYHSLHDVPVCVNPTDIDNIDTGPLYAVSVHSWATKLGS